MSWLQNSIEYRWWIRSSKRNFCIQFNGETSKGGLFNPQGLDFCIPLWKVTIDSVWISSWRHSAPVSTVYVVPLQIKCLIAEARTANSRNRHTACLQGGHWYAWVRLAKSTKKLWKAQLNTHKMHISNPVTDSSVSVKEKCNPSHIECMGWKITQRFSQSEPNCSRWLSYLEDRAGCLSACK